MDALARAPDRNILLAFFPVALAELGAAWRGGGREVGGSGGRGRRGGKGRAAAGAKSTGMLSALRDSLADIK